MITFMTILLCWTWAITLWSFLDLDRFLEETVEIRRPRLVPPRLNGPLTSLRTDKLKAFFV